VHRILRRIAPLPQDEEVIGRRPMGEGGGVVGDSARLNT
jgi:hypothetical protein